MGSLDLIRLNPNTLFGGKKMFNRRNQEEVEKLETKVWQCTSNECNCWVRDNFKSSETPLCPICESEMEQTTKIIEVIHNPSSAM